MSDHCENSQTHPCPNKPYRVVSIGILGDLGYRFTLCRKHYRGLRALQRAAA